MAIVYKYPISSWGATTLTLPINSKILKVAAINMNPNQPSQFNTNGQLIPPLKETFLWFEVEPKVELREDRTFMCVGTGIGIQIDSDKRAIYIDTTFLHNDAIVIHVYEIVDK